MRPSRSAYPWDDKKYGTLLTSLNNSEEEK
jgi:hypothetical protein